MQSKFKESLFQWRQFSQIFVFLQDALLFYCTLYTDFPGGSTDAVARRVSISQITCCDLFYPPLYTLCLKKSDTPNSIDSFVNSQQIWKFLFTSKISGKFAIHCYLRSHQLNKKSGIMLMRRARAYSSSCSRVILVYLYPFRRNSLFCSQKSPKITKNQYCQVQGHLRLSMLTFLRSSSLVLVMISSMSVHICNYFHARQANNG